MNNYKIARHYTICNAMQPLIYNAYVKALRPENEPGYLKFDRKLLSDHDSH